MASYLATRLLPSGERSHHTLQPFTVPMTEAGLGLRSGPDSSPDPSLSTLSCSPNVPGAEKRVRDRIQNKVSFPFFFPPQL